MEREVGGGIRMGNTGKSMADSFQCMTKSTTHKKKTLKLVDQKGGKCLGNCLMPDLIRYVAHRVSFCKAHNQ